MAIAFVTGQFAGNTADASATTITATFPANVGAGNCVMVHVGWETASTTCTVSGVGGTFVSANGPITDGPDDQRGQIFRAVNCSGGTAVVTATFSVSAGFRRILICEYSGVDTGGTPTDGSNGQLEASPGTGTDAVNAAKEYLKSVGETKATVTSKECSFCHVQDAKPEQVKSIKEKGYFIYKMNGCP